MDAQLVVLPEGHALDVVSDNHELRSLPTELVRAVDHAGDVAVDRHGVTLMNGTCVANDHEVDWSRSCQRVVQDNDLADIVRLCRGAYHYRAGYLL